jgi:hypothetical protein
VRISEWREAARLILACPSCFAATLGEHSSAYLCMRSTRRRIFAINH